MTSAPLSLNSPADDLAATTIMPIAHAARKVITAELSRTFSEQLGRRVRLLATFAKPIIRRAGPLFKEPHV